LKEQNDFTRRESFQKTPVGKKEGLEKAGITQSNVHAKMKKPAGNADPIWGF